jgi:hypothetical protein
MLWKKVDGGRRSSFIGGISVQSSQAVQFDPPGFKKEWPMSRFSTFGRMALVPTVALVCVVALPGCGSKVSSDNYAKIKPDMGEADVQKILGSPTSTNEDKGLLGPMTTKVWKDGDKTITVVFMQGRIFNMEKSGF